MSMDAINENGVNDASSTDGTEQDSVAVPSQTDIAPAVSPEDGEQYQPL
jgi:hypothetical protein